MLLLIMAAAQSASVPPVSVAKPLVRTTPPPVIALPPREPPRLKDRPARALLERPTPPRSRLPLPMLFSADDYPASARRNGSEGTTAVVVTINPEGRVDGCFIDDSSGDAVLDSTTCRLLASRARFEPARDEKGEAVASAATARIRWQLPPNSRVPITAWRIQSTAMVAADGRMLSCSEEMEGITRPPTPGCRGFGSIVPVGNLGTGSGPVRLRLEARLEPRAMTVAELPRAEGEVLHRVAARLRIAADGQVAGCDLIEHGGLLMFVNVRPLDCRAVFRGPYARPERETVVTTLVSVSRLR